MNKEKLSWGLILLFVGSVLLMSNLNIINFYWRSVFSMWPIILIVIGVNLLVPRSGIGSVISIVVTIAALVLLGYRGTFPPRSNWWQFDQKNGQNERAASAEPTPWGKSSGTFTREYDSTLTTAQLNIKGGAVEYEIAGITDKLFSAEATSTFGNHHLVTSTKGSHMNLTFRMTSEDKDNWQVKGGENWAKISLNPNPVWDVNLDMGAGSAEFDLTPYKIANLRFKGGAASFNAKMGMPLKETTVTVESGVASVEIEIPKAAACRIIVKSGLSSKDFPGFTKQADGSYVTEGYQPDHNRFTVNLQGGLSSFTVKRYD